MAESDLILKDLNQRYADQQVESIFLHLYDQEPPLIQIMFGHFHGQLNQLFEFMNSKKGYNGHYNADESRRLLDLMREIDDVQQLLKRAGMDLSIDPGYSNVLKESRKFLSRSGGSAIPEEFGPINIERYKCIFHIENNSIEVTPKSDQQALALVGEGAFSIVHKFIDPQYGFPVAVKTARKNSSNRELIRFRKEFDLLRKLRYPYILKAYWYDETRNRYTMEYCDYTLDKFIKTRNSKLSMNQRKRIALQFLYGLNYLHSMGVLHRDISRRNALVQEFDFSAVMIKLSDFGLHKSITSDFTQTDSSLKGTIIDPTLVSFKEYSLANEIYAIGVVLSFIFSGKEALGACEGAIGDIVDKCTHKKPSERYESVLGIIREIENLKIG